MYPTRNQLMEDGLTWDEAEDRLADLAEEMNDDARDRELERD